MISNKSGGFYFGPHAPRLQVDRVTFHVPSLRAWAGCKGTDCRVISAIVDVIISRLGG